jgi:hypothetical protein
MPNAFYSLFAFFCPAALRGVAFGSFAATAGSAGTGATEIA